MKIKVHLAALLSLLLVGILPYQVFASETAVQALTTPPPIEIVPYSAFDSTFKYLENGMANLSIVSSSGKIMLEGESTATQYVSTIGVRTTLQRWTGSVWEDYNVGQDLSVSNDNYIITSRQLTVPTGYYYRIRSLHWTIQNSVREQGERFTSSLLVN
ncbi:hypothetical protein H8B09_09560 [Paenibacillus sp. PR3]|uniref:Uncharacterized protein n=1 Tax=Paenibacillus terricola TaxID=2763503 RepID=A0ABR8MSQ0_9BACL|nr:hypothetical protein [Paenibacillus terricola]MBD3918999.1 hypothetical protein [Paenibacillus terricola]